ncbi:hypothetical protein [Aliidiomarina sanyensis]|uniref:Uncharacterized protein n=1 Tax=Aliidiomarina sanyensis TaxID=1249555 RepID=A0A432WCK0_9GAMM|nr:hypothetical protein [Aliidiomarina sanyensis]RUO30133.1 hypothetical protein CWE11_09230 [Aliidiomarina sanyensis]
MRTLLIILTVVLALALFGPAIFTLAVEGVLALLVPVLVVALLAGVGFFVGAVLLGSTVIGGLIVLGVLLMVGFSVFWPLLLILFVAWLFTRSRTQQA